MSRDIAVMRDADNQSTLLRQEEDQWISRFNLEFVVSSTQM